MSICGHSVSVLCAFFEHSFENGKLCVSRSGGDKEADARRQAIPKDAFEPAATPTSGSAWRPGVPPGERQVRGEVVVQQRGSGHSGGARGEAAQAQGECGLHCQPHHGHSSWLG